MAYQDTCFYASRSKKPEPLLRIPVCVLFCLLPPYFRCLCFTKLVHIL